jgi:hypothetical protein
MLFFTTNCLWWIMPPCTCMAIQESSRTCCGKPWLVVAHCISLWPIFQLAVRNWIRLI